MPTTSVIPSTRSRTILVASLWFAQLLLFLAFAMSGFVKLATPIDQLAAMMPWTGEAPLWFVRSIGVIDLAGGIGILLPALTRVRPNLTVAAAVGCAMLQVCAMLFHLLRGEAAVLPLNVVLLALSIFVFWGRGWPAPVAPRGA